MFLLLARLLELLGSKYCHCAVNFGLGNSFQAMCDRVLWLLSQLYMCFRSLLSVCKSFWDDYAYCMHNCALGESGIILPFVPSATLTPAHSRLINNLQIQVSATFVFIFYCNSRALHFLHLLLSRYVIFSYCFPHVYYVNCMIS